MDPVSTAMLSGRLRDPAFTPGVRDVPELFERWRAIVSGSGSGSGERRAITKLMVQALGRADRPVASMLLRDLWETEAAERALRVRVVSRIAARIEIPELEPVLTRALADSDARVVRAALRAIGNLDDGEAFEEAVVAQLQGGALPEQRAAADTLGKIGGRVALAALQALDADDSDLARRCDQAIALIERRQRRREPTAILTASPLPEAVSVVLRCRPGMARFAREQALAFLGAGAGQLGDDPVGVALSWSGALEPLYRVRIALDVALAFELSPGTTAAQRIAETLSRPDLIASLRAWSDGPLRFRLAFADGAARRSVVRDVAAALADRDVPLSNDSRDAPWSAEVDLEHHRLLLSPKDARAGERPARIPAASHRTLAALMAWVGRPRPGEVVWDPFCGSGSELVECALLEPTVRLFGTDQSDEALDAARQNLEAAGLAAEPGALVRADSLQTDPTATPSLIITNPPMNRRVASGYGVHQLLQRFVSRAADLLPPAGRLVWVTPAAAVSASAAKDASLQLTDHGPIDLAGLRVGLQVLTKPSSG